MTAAEVARALVEHRQFKWLPGMVAILDIGSPYEERVRVDAVDADGVWIVDSDTNYRLALDSRALAWVEASADLSDPATAGALLPLLAATGRLWNVQPLGDEWSVSITVGIGGMQGFRCGSLGEALGRALLVAWGAA
jgi:hypothetical protein